MVCRFVIQSHMLQHNDDEKNQQQIIIQIKFIFRSAHQWINQIYEYLINDYEFTQVVM